MTDKSTKETKKEEIQEEKGLKKASKKEEVKEEVVVLDNKEEVSADATIEEGAEVQPADGEVEKAAPVASVKKRNLRRQVQRGKAFISSSYNNTKVLLADLHGNSLAWSSAGHLGFKGAKKATTYAAGQVVADVHEKVQKYGLRDIEVFVKGIGSGREAALRALAQKGYNITKIKDTTPIPHNGCRPKGPRRV